MLPPPAPRAVLERVERQIAWLKAVLAKARAAKGPHKFGLFGSSVAATSLLGELGGEVAFFVDEDRAGNAPRSSGLYARDSKAYRPHSGWRAVAGRLARPRVRFCIPPEMVA
jgi:hypothetical protein